MKSVEAVVAQKYNLRFSRFGAVPEASLWFSEDRNKATGSNLKAPAPNPKTKSEKARKKSFCARSRSWTGERGKAARKRWKC